MAIVHFNRGNAKKLQFLNISCLADSKRRPLMKFYRLLAEQDCPGKILNYSRFCGILIQWGKTMTVAEAVKILDGQFFWGQEKADLEVASACGADLMSDVMAFVKDKVILLTGLVNPQVIRTAELLDIRCIIFVRGKVPNREMTEMAEESDIILAGTKLSMFLSCGKLYEGGLKTGGTRAI